MPSFWGIIWHKLRTEDIMLKYMTNKNKMFGLTQWPWNIVICIDPDIIAQVFSKQFTSFTNRRTFQMGGDPIGDNMLNNTRDDHWKRLRAVVSPTFTSGKLRKMRPLIDDCLHTLVTNLDKLSKESDEGVVDMKKVFGAFTMEVIIQVAFGTKVDALIDDNNPIISNAKKIVSKDFTLLQLPRIMLILIFPKVANIFGLSLFPREMSDFFVKLIHKIITERRNNPSVKRYDFLQLLLDANEGKDNDLNEETEVNEDNESYIQTHNKTISEDEMIAQCVLFFFAGYETTTTTLSFASHLLAENPDSQQKVYNEALSVFGSESIIDFEAIERLEYLNAVISETLRLYPPAIRVERQASRDLTLGDKNQFKIFKGDVIQVPVYGMHRSAQFFTDPQVFKPDRFLANNQTHHPYSYLPFGAGPRNCVAKRLALMETKMALLYTVYNYKLEICNKTACPPECYYQLGLIVPKAVNLKLEKSLIMFEINIVQDYYVILFVIAVLTFIFTFKYKSNCNYKNQWAKRGITIGKLPSFWGMIWYKRRAEDIMIEFMKNNENIFGFKQFGWNTIMCSNPDIIGQVFSKEFTSFTNRRSFQTGGDPIMDNMLQNTRDDHWKRLRAVVSPTFSSGKLRKMRPLIDDCLHTLVTNLDKLSKESDEGVVDMKKVFGAFTMEVIIQVAFGTKVDALIDDNNPIISNAKKIISKDVSILQLPKFMLIMTFPKIAKLLGLTLIPNDLSDFFSKLTHKIITERRNNPSVKRYDFLQLLLDANENVENVETNCDNIEEKERFVSTHQKTISDDEMIAQCVLFFFAGFDTTATTISFATYLLAENPESQEKLFRESLSVFETKEIIDFDAIERLEYLNAVISETLRLYPPAIAVERMASRDVVVGNENKFHIFKGDVLQVPVYGMHRSDQHFEDPETFKPDRFLTDNQTHHPYSYLPFGAGPRNCVAKRLALMEVKFALLYTVYNYKLDISDKTARPPELYYQLGIIIPKAVNLKIIKRYH
ncbi:uncharacterized protein LOC128961559 [Oppia nitens]|uniref:uncharacterized protein LOC128961559 n=1 Tax=Oppia nitens TaxID=1686743 RepID=UPI0023DBF145|nr:uncharacterized protein LOC128961559 [Oppia nitens]